MSLKYYKPITPGRRHLIGIDYKVENIWRKDPIKSLVKKCSRTGGRNNQGRTTIFHRGGGAKRLYRCIDFKRQSLFEVPAKIQRIEYDPNRSCFIALIIYKTGDLAYIIAPKNIKVGDFILTSKNKNPEIKLGNCLPLKNVPIGSTIHNIELYPGKGGQICRSAGTEAKLIKRDRDSALIRLTSNKEKTLSINCFCTIGSVSNSDHKNRSYGKAGQTRWQGKKPTVRGVAMNPIDHPHGGGEGKTSGGRCSVTPWGIPTKGYKTRRNKK